MMVTVIKCFFDNYSQTELKYIDGSSHEVLHINDHTHNVELCWWS